MKFNVGVDVRGRYYYYLSSILLATGQEQDSDLELNCVRHVDDRGEQDTMCEVRVCKQVANTATRGIRRHDGVEVDFCVDGQHTVDRILEGSFLLGRKL